MKRIILLGIGFFCHSLLAHPCFPVGNYEGMGMFKDGSQNTGSYRVNVSVSDAEHAKQTYETPKGDVTLDYTLENGQIFVNQSKAAVGDIQCGLSTLTLKTEYRHDGQSVTITEEWLSVGNYLLRSGIKVVGASTIKYQELLVKQ